MKYCFYILYIWVNLRICDIVHFSWKLIQSQYSLSESRKGNKQENMFNFLIFYISTNIMMSNFWTYNQYYFKHHIQGALLFCPKHYWVFCGSFPCNPTGLGLETFDLYKIQGKNLCIFPGLGRQSVGRVRECGLTEPTDNICNTYLQYRRSQWRDDDISSMYFVLVLIFN